MCPEGKPMKEAEAQRGDMLISGGAGIRVHIFWLFPGAWSFP